MRCLALAQAWQGRGGQAVFVTGSGFEALEHRLRESGIPIHHAQGASGSIQDAQHLSRIAQNLGAHWVVVDGYAFQEDYQLALKQHGYKIVWIDDYAHAPIEHVDIVVNQNIYADLAMYPDPPGETVFLLGSQYAMIRREFRQCQGASNQPASKEFHLLVTLGGATHHQVLTKIIHAAASLQGAPLEIKVVVGLAQSHDDDFQHAVESCPHDVQLIHNPSSMPDLMHWAHVAVSAAGGTCWELAYMGVPHLVVVIADNQQPIAAGLHDRGQAVSLGWHYELDTHVCAQQLARLIRDPAACAAMSRKGREMIDGLGANRVLDEMLCASMRIRRAASDDVKRVYQWSNDRTVRQNAFSTDPIVWDDHVAWYQRRLNDPDCFFYICEDQDHDPLGQVRFDVQSGQTFVTINIRQDLRGRGVGGAMIRKALCQFLTDAHPCGVYALIKPANTASLNAFRRSGFRFDQDLQVNGVPAKRYVFRPARL